MVGIPQALASLPRQIPVGQQRRAARAARVPELPCRNHRIHTAVGAYAVVALEHLLAQVARLGAQLPLVDAILGAKRKSSARDFQGTPPAQPAPVRTTGNRLAINPSSLDETHRAHSFFVHL